MLRRFACALLALCFSAMVQAQVVDESGGIVQAVERAVLVSQPLEASAQRSAAAVEAPSSAPNRLWATDAEAVWAIAQKLRLAVGVVKGAYPRNAKVVLEAALFPTGRTLFARIAKSSGFRALDQQVLHALQRAEPLPVPPSVAEADAVQIIRLVYSPYVKR